MTAAPKATYFLGAYWSARKESSETCAERISGFLRGVGQIDERCAHWFVAGRSRRKALTVEVRIDRDFVERSLLATRDARLPESLRESLGFTFSIWNGASTDTRSISILFRCGVFADNIGNSVVLSCAAECDLLADYERAQRAMIAVVRSFEPEWAVVSTTAIAQFVSTFPNAPRPGLLTFVRKGVNHFPSIVGIESKSLDRDGVILVATVSPNLVSESDRDKLIAMSNLIIG